MSDPVLKPWSQVEEDINGNDLDVTASEPAATQDRAPDPSRGAGSFDVQPDRHGVPSRPRIRTHWALMPLGLATGTLLWGILRSDAGGVTPTMGWVCLALIGTSGIVLTLAIKSRRNAISRILRAVELHTEPVSIASVASQFDPELAPVWKAVESYTTHIDQRVSDMIDTDQKLNLELTLAESRKNQAVDIVEALANPIFATDSHGRLIMTNPAADELFGISRGQCLRKPIKEVITDEGLLNQIQQTRQADTRAAERRAEHSIGNRLYSSTLVPLIPHENSANEEKADHGVVIHLRDITREREASKNKSDFVSHVAHELRTPLSSICAYVEMLVDGEANDEKTRREYYEIIQTSTDRLRRLIDNMLNISRIEAGTVRIHKEPMALSPVVKEAVDVMRPSAEEKNITLTEHLTPVVFRVNADRDLIYQSVLNLLSNAVKYTPSGGRVTVRITPREEEHKMLIEVSDTGAGIPKEDIPKMFGKFFRVEANKKIAKGTGLGLNLVKKIVETVHEGEIGLKSEVGQGSTFRIVLPLMA